MDTELLIEVHQYYINSLKKQLSEERKPLVESVLGKYVSVYISQTSCIHGHIKFYDSSDTEIRVTECKRTPGTSVGIPCATYDFPSKKNIRRIVITRPVCTDMLNSYVKIFDEVCVPFTRIPFHSPVLLRTEEKIFDRRELRTNNNDRRR